MDQLGLSPLAALPGARQLRMCTFLALCSRRLADDLLKLVTGRTSFVPGRVARAGRLRRDCDGREVAASSNFLLDKHRSRRWLRATMKEPARGGQMTTEERCS